MSQKSVIIVESPSKAKTISKYLDDQYEVVACVGHVKDLPRGSLGVDVDNKFQMELVVLDDKKDFFKQLASKAKSAPEIILATDPDREGERLLLILHQRSLIQRYLVFNLQKLPILV